MQSNLYRTNVYTGNKTFLETANARYDEMMKKRDDLHEQFIVKRIQDIEHLIPEDVRNHPRFGLMTEDELKQAIRESYEREQEKRDVFKREYLGIWVEDDESKFIK